MDFDPAALVILLNLNRLVFQPLQVLQFLDPLLEICFAAIVEDAWNDSTSDAKELVPGHGHNHKHNQVEKCELQNDEETVEYEEQEDECQSVEQGGHEAGSLLDSRMIQWVKVPVYFLELSPKVGILNVSFT